MIVGFLPYWLFEKTNSTYGKTISVLSYFALTIDSDGTIVKLTNPREEDPGWFSLKSDTWTQHNQSIGKSNGKTSLTVHLADEDVIELLMQNPVQHAQNLVHDVSPIMKSYGFSDLNIDIESFREATPSSQAQFTAFLRTVTNEIRKNKMGTITLDISPSAFIRPFLIDPKAVEPYVDYLLLMAYDYHYTGSLIAGPVAPVGGVPTVRELDVETSLTNALNIYPPGKILLGIPLYGYEWETIRNEAGSATIPGGGVAASAKRVSELVSTCTNCTQGYDEIAKQPYVVFPDQPASDFHVIYYENEKSLRDKISLAKKYHIAGIALWALGYETDPMFSALSEFKKYVWISKP